MKTSGIALFFKGMAMGTVDIVPGVSGSTVAVLLGIYERFIAALKNIGLSLIKALILPFRKRFSLESRQTCKKACEDADLFWLLILLAGLGTAFVVASFVIPSLMEKFPQIMRGVFFGLVLGSIITPIRSIKIWRIKHILCIFAFAAAFYVILGVQVNAPVQVASLSAQNGQTLESICFELPCFNASSDVLAMPENAPLREAGLAVNSTLPDGMTVFVQKPYFLFCLAAGFLAICAMLLPGISGSFILLVLGCYYFMLNTGKGFLAALAHGHFYGHHLLYLGCFVVGALTGIAVFSRALSWLLQKHHSMTLAAIIGILLGCLRAVWPYRVLDDSGISHNIIPQITDPQLFSTMIAIVVGLLVVTITVVLQIRFEKTTHE